MAKLYIYCTNDEYQLPLAVADSVKELAAMIGRAKQSVWEGLAHNSRTFDIVVISEEELNNILEGKG